MNGYRFVIVVHQVNVIHFDVRSQVGVFLLIFLVVNARQCQLFSTVSGCFKGNRLSLFARTFLQLEYACPLLVIMLCIINIRLIIFIVLVIQPIPCFGGFNIQLIP